MPIVLTILTFVAVLVFLMIVHELGHFLTARACRVKVEEFGLGLPPRIWGFKRGGTIYSLNWIPFGAFVRMLGEEDPAAKGSLAGKSRKVRFLVLSAGSAMNLLLPVLLFSVAFMIPHPVLVEDVHVSEVAVGSPAEAAGMSPGDTILSINNNEVRSRSDLAYYIRLNLGSSVDIGVRTEEGVDRVLRVVPRWNPPPEQGAVGFTMEVSNSRVITETLPFWQAIPQGAVRSWEMLVLFRNEILSWIIGSSSPQLAGPIGIAQMTGEVARAGWGPLLEFTALISINLGIINLFPIPGLDGGRLIFVILEFLRRGKRVSPQREGLIHFAGFVTLLLLIAVITYFDVVRVVSGGSLFP